MCPSPPWFHHHKHRLLTGVLGLLWSVLAGGCATATTSPKSEAVHEFAGEREPAKPEFIPVVRYGRYTLVELAPMAAQRDLLLQTIDVSMPEDVRATVGDGLRHVLKRSGYELCQSAQVAIELYALPLPAAHLHLGPMTVRDALLTLAGPSWELHADDRTRQICFEHPGSGRGSQPIRELPATEPVQTFPLRGGQS